MASNRMEADEMAVAREIIEVPGSMVAVLDKLVDPKALLWVLLDRQVDNRSILAYRTVACQVPDEVQYLDGLHFLQRAIDRSIDITAYGAIYLLSGCSPELPIREDRPIDSNNRPVEELLFDSYKSLYLDYSFDVKISMICNQDFRGKDGISVQLMDPDPEGFTLIDLIAAALSKSWITGLHQHQEEIVDALVRFGYLRAVDTEGIVKRQTILIKRCLELARKAPHYWARIKPKYEEFIRTEPISRELVDYPSEQWSEIKEIFPGLFEEPVYNLAKSLQTFPRGIQAYLLGFDLSSMQPTDRLIEQAINDLERQGIQAWCEQYRARHRKWLEQTGPFIGEGEMINDRDTLYVDPWAYSPFDVMKYYEGTRGYYFTRPEFKNLVEKGRNYWTNNRLSPGFLETLKYRQGLAEKLKLPPSESLEDLLKKVEQHEIQPPKRSQPLEIAQGLVELSDPNTINEHMGRFFTVVMSNS